MGKKKGGRKKKGGSGWKDEWTETHLRMTEDLLEVLEAMIVTNLLLCTFCCGHHPSIHPSIYLSTHPPIHSSIHPFIHPFIHPSIPPLIYQSIHNHMTTPHHLQSKKLPPLTHKSSLYLNPHHPTPNLIPKNPLSQPPPNPPNPSLPLPHPHLDEILGAGGGREDDDAEGILDELDEGG